MHFQINKIYLYMILNRITLPSDSIGIIASSLCAIHCIATPFVFIAKACSVTCCAEAPLWWVMIDYAFLIISFIAIYYTNKNSSVTWLKYFLWISWFLLLITISNHSIEFMYLPENFIYIPAFSIIILHLYNLKFCKCKGEKCCNK